MSEFEYGSFEEVADAIEAGVQDCLADNPGGEVSGDDAAHDIAISLMTQCPPGVKYEIAISYLGWDPEEDSDLFKQHSIPTKLEYYG
jgi:hypothetical protein